MGNKILFIDYENVQPNHLEFLVKEEIEVYLFVGAKQNRLPIEIVEGLNNLKSKTTYIRISKTQKNALDFHITYYLGKLLTEQPDTLFFILSKDTGYDPLIDHINQVKMCICRISDIRQIKNSYSKLTFNERVKHFSDEITHSTKPRPRSITNLRRRIAQSFHNEITATEINEIVIALSKERVMLISRSGSIRYPKDSSSITSKTKEKSIENKIVNILTTKADSIPTKQKSLHNFIQDQLKNFRTKSKPSDIVAYLFDKNIIQSDPLGRLLYNVKTVSVVAHTEQFIKQVAIEHIKLKRSLFPTRVLLFKESLREALHQNGSNTTVLEIEELVHYLVKQKWITITNNVWINIVNKTPQDSLESLQVKVVEYFQQNDTSLPKTLTDLEKTIQTQISSSLTAPEVRSIIIWMHTKQYIHIKTDHEVLYFDRLFDIKERIDLDTLESNQPANNKVSRKKQIPNQTVESAKPDPDPNATQENRENLMSAHTTENELLKDLKKVITQQKEPSSCQKVMGWIRDKMHW